MIETKETNQLTIGVVPSDSLSTELTCEILEHQGVIYELVNQADPKRKIYPVVLLPENSSSTLTKAASICISADNVLIVDKIVDLQKIKGYLSGETVSKQDQFNCFVNAEESKLVSKIGERLDASDLPLVTKSIWPNNARACCVITHDIDWFTYSPFHKVVFDGISNPLQIAKLVLANLIRHKDYGWNIPEMVDLERVATCKSTFLFRTEYYEYELDLLRRSLELIKRNNAGSEIALHASHSSHSSDQALETELSKFKTMFGHEPSGIRYHTLKFDVPKTWNIESRKSMQYDATFSYNEYIGFRSEICFPYHPFDGKCKISIVEIPTAIMDWTLLHRKLRGRNAELVLQKAKETVEKYNGVLTVNFHNSYINKSTFPDIYNLYSSLLKQVVQDNYWVATAEECVKWWNVRSSALIEPKLTGENEITARPTPVQLVVKGKKPYSMRYA